MRGSIRTIMMSLAALLLLPLSTPGEEGAKEACQPTRPDALGPFYQPGAPLRDKVGDGYLLTGTVRSSADCLPVSGAKIELWLVGPNRRYDDAHRATVLSGQSGHYRFESNFPPPYEGRPPHIHIRVSAPGYRTLVTQHYPVIVQQKGVFDLVLIPKQ